MKLKLFTLFGTNCLVFSAFPYAFLPVLLFQALQSGSEEPQFYCGQQHLVVNATTQAPEQLLELLLP
jgi:hypothetical protein